MIAGSLPNILTISRILLLPFFAATLIYGYYGFALGLFLAAALTDVLDGFIARMTDQTTLLGSILDPVADKFLLITSFIIMTVYGWIPTWMTIVVISRDLIVVTGWLILYFVTHDLKVEASILGKAANVLQLMLLVVILIEINLKTGTPMPMAFLVTVASVTAISGVQYIYRGLQRSNEKG